MDMLQPIAAMAANMCLKALPRIIPITGCRDKQSCVKTENAWEA